MLLACWLSLCVLVYSCDVFMFFFFKQKTAYEMRISDWSSDVCSSDLVGERKIMKALLCAVVLALLPSGAFAMSGREYLDHCARMTVYDRAQCMGSLDAILRRATGTDFRNDQRRAGDHV